MMAASGGSINNNNNIPPGFFFSPTDEELIVHFLYSKATSLPFYHPNIIPDLDYPHLDPWQLNGNAFSSGNQHYFFSKMKENRATENGYWKEIAVTKPIFSSEEADKKVGIKKFLEFNLGESQSQGTETIIWVMEEYHICSSAFSTSEQNGCKWVLCRVYEKRRSQSSSQQADPNYCYSDEDDNSGTELSWLDEVYLSLDDLDDLEEINKPA